MEHLAQFAFWFLVFAALFIFIGGEHMNVAITVALSAAIAFVATVGIAILRLFVQ